MEHRVTRALHNNRMFVNYPRVEITLIYNNPPVYRHFFLVTTFANEKKSHLHRDSSTNCRNFRLKMSIRNFWAL